MVTPPEQNVDLKQNRQKLTAWQRFFQFESHVLMARPWLLLQQAANQPDVTTIAGKAMDHLCREGARPWLRWVNKPSTVSPGIRTIVGHSGSVYSSEISPDGNRLYSAGSDGTIRAWSFPGGRELERIQAHAEGAWGMALSPCESRLVSWSDEGEMALWDLRSGELVSRETEGGDIVDCKFLPFGERYLTFNRLNRKVGLRVSRSGKLLASVTGLVAPTPDGKQLIVADSRGWFHLIDTETGHVQESARQTSGFRSPFVVSPDGKRLLLSHENETTEVPHTVFGLQTTAICSNMKFPRDGVFSADGRRLAVPDDFSLVLFDGVTGSKVATCSGHADVIVDCAFSPAGNRVVTASLDATLRVWNTSDGKLLTVLRGHQNEVRSVAYAPDGRFVVSASLDGAIRTWQADAEGDYAAPSHAASVTLCQFHPDGKTVLTSGADGLFKLWDGRKGEELNQFEARCPFPKQFACFPDGNHFVSVGTTYDTIPIVRDWETGAKLTELTGLPVDAECTMFCTVSPDGRWILAGSDDGTVKAWGLGPNSDTLTIFGPSNASPTRARFSAKSDFAAVCFDDGSLRILKLPSWEPWVEFATLDGKGISSFSFLPEPGAIVAASGNGLLHVWDYEEKSLLGLTSTGRAGLSSLSTSPDGSYFLANCPEGILVWLIPVNVKEMTTGELCRAIGTSAYAVSPDGAHLASVDEKGWLIVWGIHSRRIMAEMPLPGPGQHVTWNSFGDRISVAVGHEGLVYEGGQSSVGYMLLVDPRNLDHSDTKSTRRLDA